MILKDSPTLRLQLCRFMMIYASALFHTVTDDFYDFYDFYDFKRTGPIVVPLLFHAVS